MFARKICLPFECNDWSLFSVLNFKALIDFTMDQLESVTTEISSHFQSRQLWIDELDDVLTNMENERVARVIYSLFKLPSDYSSQT